MFTAASADFAAALMRTLMPLLISIRFNAMPFLLTRFAAFAASDTPLLRHRDKTRDGIAVGRMY